jgi:hypothetical protein
MLIFTDIKNKARTIANIKDYASTVKNLSLNRFSFIFSAFLFYINHKRGENVRNFLDL